MSLTRPNNWRSSRNSRFWSNLLDSEALQITLFFVKILFLNCYLKKCRRNMPSKLRKWTMKQRIEWVDESLSVETVEFYLKWRSKKVNLATDLLGLNFGVGKTIRTVRLLTVGLLTLALSGRILGKPVVSTGCFAMLLGCSIINDDYWKLLTIQ